MLVRLLSRSLQKGTLSFNLVSTHSPSQTRQHWLSSHRSRVMAVLFGWQGTNSLATMPCSTFSKKVVSASSFVTTERLLSTECVTKLHFCRTYPQPCQFLTSSNCSLAQYNPFLLFAHRCDFWNMISSVIPDTIIRLRDFLTRKCFMCPS